MHSVQKIKVCLKVEKTGTFNLCLSTYMLAARQIINGMRHISGKSRISNIHIHTIVSKICEIITKQDRKCTYYVTLRRVRATIVAAEKQ
jgi:hypothetical protein